MPSSTAAPESESPLAGIFICFSLLVIIFDFRVALFGCRYSDKSRLFTE